VRPKEPGTELKPVLNNNIQKANDVTQKINLTFAFFGKYPK
jgi:hypothetical protein